MIDYIFEMDWPELNDSFKKAFLMVMNRATIPIEFTSAHLFSMNLESFVGVNIIKFIILAADFINKIARFSFPSVLYILIFI